MYKKRSFISKGVELMAFGVGVGALVAGCGGGGGSGGGTATETAVSSYIADQQAGGFVGSWRALVGSSSSVADAYVTTLAATATANTYTSSEASKLLTSGIWGPNPNAWVLYVLNTAGWVEYTNTVTLVDVGNGSDVTASYAGLPAIGATVTKTSLAATPIVCTSPTTGATIACVAPGSYPAGATSYQVSSTYATDGYFMFGATGAIPWFPLTDATGVPLTALPAAGATFCDPNYRMAFQTIAPAPAVGANNYNVFAVTSCSAANITAGTAGTPTGTVLISNQATGNAIVANVLRVQSPTGAPVAWMNNYIFGLMAGNVWYGWTSPAGSVNSSVEKNKAAINAELLASGLVALP